MTDQEIAEKVVELVCGEENELGMLDVAEETEKLSEVAEDIIFGVTADESLEKIFVVMVMKEI